MWIALVHRDCVALELIRINLPRHGGRLPFPDLTRPETEVSTIQGLGPSDQNPDRNHDLINVWSDGF